MKSLSCCPLKFRADSPIPSLRTTLIYNRRIFRAFELRPSIVLIYNQLNQHKNSTKQKYFRADGKIFVLAAVWPFPSLRPVPLHGIGRKGSGRLCKRHKAAGPTPFQEQSSFH